MHVITVVLIIFFLSFFLSFLFWLFLPTHCRCRGSLLHLITLNDNHTHAHSVGILWTRDRPFSDTSTWQNTTPTKHTNPLPGRIRTRNPKTERAQTHALNRAGTGIDTRHATVNVALPVQTALAVVWSTQTAGRLNKNVYESPHTYRDTPTDISYGLRCFGFRAVDWVSTP